MATIPQIWFEMADQRRRRFANAVWIPLRSIETIVREGRSHRLGSKEELLFAGSVAFPPQNRIAAERLGWSDIGVMHDGGPYAFEDGRYKVCETFQYHDGVDLGVDLVFVQHLNSDHANVWHLSQDLVMALNLIQEGDSWLRVDEDYVEVVRQRRDESGRIIAIEIKNEFLRDYLAARGLALRLAIYRQRTAVVEDASYVDWAVSGLIEEAPGDRFEARVIEVDADGDLLGDVAIFHSWRTDVDVEEDVPVFEPENDTNTAGRSASYTRKAAKAYRIDGELWREEWIEPSARSERVRGDEAPEQCYYIVDAGGGREPAAALNSENVGRWLWFDPTVILELCRRRGGSLGWYTGETGFVRCSPDYITHFGVNRLGLLNVYAYDIAKLPSWQQRIWVSSNIAPNGPVSAELLASQMEANPAETVAAEDRLAMALTDLDESFESWLGTPLFRRHEATEGILKIVHRFRAVGAAGLLGLAKDLARLTADRADLGPLRAVVAPPKGENWGTLKSIEKVLATQIDPSEARRLMAPLVGVYELRLGDAHLPSEALRDAYRLVGLNTDTDLVNQGREMIEITAGVLSKISEIAKRAGSFSN